MPANVSRSISAPLARPAITLVGLVLCWQALVWATAIEPFLLPPPAAVLDALILRHEIILKHAGVTLLEIVLGLVLGVLLGTSTALLMALSGEVRRWLMPVLVVSQAIPVFALAPILVLWLGYGLASKVAMAALIIFFPVTAAFHDGLRRTDKSWIDSARTLGCTGWRLLWRVRMPAALPGFAAGLRIAAAVAPIGAVVGEWVGSSAGLGYLMLHANARLQIDLLFAALIVLAAMAVSLYFLIDIITRRALHWQPETDPA
ncbi:ABC transporter permease [Oceanibaculum pacificum]|uniref:ABC transporter permease n=1 Tax=Oceanibaculum pacificum TaxID=580166 RepID=A0A154VXC2_9PROT|nr:ABC transporter permease [Oceanibaculum pacificum]KZD05861.1 ABC transporter permease [Oceanibaculum pacificum]